jgi:DNA polymerase-3 subunit epsilon
VDVETTGFSPRLGDRVAEVAVVQLDALGSVQESWSTLVNPQRDLGPQHVHRITARDVLQAPLFSEIAGELARRLAGRVFVAHNASFDRGFIASEFERCGWPVPLAADATVCTMRWSKRLLGAPGKLPDCCDFLGIEIQGHHTALGDAADATRILQTLMAEALADARTLISGRLPWHEAIATAARCDWPSIPRRETRTATRGRADLADPPGASFIDNLGNRLGPARDSTADSRYLKLLDAVLIDRVVSVRENRALVELAGELGIGRAQALRLNQRYLEALAQRAMEDGVLDRSERADLAVVGRLLGVGETALSELMERLTSPEWIASAGPLTSPERTASAWPRGLKPAGAGSAARGVTADARDVTSAARGVTADARGATPAAPGDGPSMADGFFHLNRGDGVVFTGQMARPREEWVALAAAAGLVSRPNVTKQVALVVAADPDSLSGKARKADQYGIPIVTEDAFAVMLAELVERSP